MEARCDCSKTEGFGISALLQHIQFDTKKCNANYYFTNYDAL
jgi:hypothetical protein